MPVIAEAAAEVRLIARRGASAAAVVIGAGFHPLRTVKGGVSIVRGLVNPPDSPVQPAPTDAKPGTQSTSNKGAGNKGATGTGKSTGSKSTPPEAKPIPVPPAHSVEPTEETAEEQRAAAEALEPELPDPDAVADVDVEPSGPAPHIPPSLAQEIERDYGDDLPGMHAGGE